MKKRTVITIITLSLFLMSGIVAIDYYRSIYVSYQEENKSVHEELGNASDVFVQDDNVLEEPKNSCASFCFFGDNLIHENVLNYANLRAGGNGERSDYGKGFDFKHLYKEVLPYVEKADFSVCNQSSLVGANDAPESLSGYPLFNSPSALGKDLVSIGFDAVNIGNNHLLDMGYDGLQNSLEFWKTQKITQIGGYLSEDEKLNAKNKLIEINNIRCAFLSFTANTNGLYDENGDCIPYFTLRGTEIMKIMLESEVKKCDEISDIVIVMINWANTAGFEVTEIQKTTANILCNAGADVIIGSGPKTIQAVEWLVGENGTRTLCAYSLGNFMGTMQYTENLLGGALTFNVAKNGEETVLKDVLFHPTVIHYNENFTDIAVFPLEKYSPEQFMLHGSNIKYGNKEYPVLLDIFKRNIPVTFLTDNFK